MIFTASWANSTPKLRYLQAFGWRQLRSTHYFTRRRMVLDVCLQPEAARKGRGALGLDPQRLLVSLRGITLRLCADGSRCLIFLYRRAYVNTDTSCQLPQLLHIQ